MNLKEKLHNGESVLGTMITVFDHVDMLRIFKNTGFDFVIVDNELGYFDYKELSLLLNTGKLLDFPVLVRIAEPRREIVAKCMEMGAAGLLIPNCDGPAMAQQVISYAKYAPMGNRGVSLGRANTNYEKVDALEYMKKVNDETIIMCQIESPEGVENVEKTAAVEGVDCLFIGPNDLTQSYGIMGQTQNPIFIDAVKRVIKAAKAENKACGIHLQNTDGVKKWMAEGMNMNLYGNDAALLKNACQAGVSAIRGE